MEKDKRFIELAPSTWEAQEDYVMNMLRSPELKKFCADRGIDHASGFFGPPRGGTFYSALAAYATGLPMLGVHRPNCVITDGIADAGRSLSHFLKTDTQFNDHFLTVHWMRPERCDQKVQDAMGFIGTEISDGRWVHFRHSAQEALRSAAKLNGTEYTEPQIEDKHRIPNIIIPGQENEKTQVTWTHVEGFIMAVRDQVRKNKIKPTGVVGTTPIGKILAVLAADILNIDQFLSVPQDGCLSFDNNTATAPGLTMNLVKDPTKASLPWERFAERYRELEGIKGKPHLITEHLQNFDR